MFLTASNLVFHLISRGVITAESVVKGNFTLVEVGRRNRNFKVFRNAQPGLFVKQVKTSEPQAISTLQREATFYQRVKENPQFSFLKELAPAFIDYDPSRYALVIDLLSDSESLAEYQQRSNLNLEVAAELGRRLGKCHAQLPAVMNDPSAPALLHADVPWIMELEKTGYAAMSALGGIGPPLAAAIQQYPNLQPLLSGLKAMWQYDSLIHGDPKLENWMVLPNGNGEINLRLIDWELVDIGDGAWDVAMVFKEFLVIWLLSQPDANNPTPHGFAPTVPRQISEVQPAIKTFWDAYVLARQFSPDVAASYLIRSTRFTAARLVVAVMEYFFPLTQLNNHAMTMLMLSASILQTPETAITQLLGLTD
jgi:Phosphotransferase enzyme family